MKVPAGQIPAVSSSLSPAHDDFLFMLLHHQFAYNSPPYILSPLCLCSFFPHIQECPSLPSLMWLIFIHSLRLFPEVFPDTLPHLPNSQTRVRLDAPSLSSQSISGVVFKLLLLLCPLCSCTRLVFYQVSLYSCAWLISNQ